jgi:endonuclease-3
VIGEPGADKILLFSGMAPIAAVPSACTGVPQRIFFGHEDKNYGKGYRAAQEAIAAEIPENFEARQRAYLLLKKHGQEICKRTKPKCEVCPVSVSARILNKAEVGIRPKILRGEPTLPGARVFEARIRR